MSNIPAIFKRDAYKFAHCDQLPEGMTKSVSYFVPRGTRLIRWNKVMNIGLQGVMRELVEDFDKTFFKRSWYKVSSEYMRVLNETFGEGNFSLKPIEELHDLHYLPLEVRQIPEGTIVPVGTPLFSITNTDERFAWLPQALESYLSAQLWHTMIAGTVSYAYREIVESYYNLTCDDDVSKWTALSNFDFRGDESFESAVLTGLGWATCFTGSATIPTAFYLRDYYEVDFSNTIRGALSTEHAVMCSNYAVDGDEATFIKRMLLMYPNKSFSMVLDAYDYDNVVDNIIPSLKREILAHNGCLLVRGDSGDPVDVTVSTVERLWKTFGGTVNSKGYKVLDKHIGVIYGDSITLGRCQAIYRRLMDLGFASNNVKLGVGSFSMEAVEDFDGKIKPFTRDTFNDKMSPVDAIINGVEYPIYKAPKGADFKKSYKGAIRVTNVDGRWKVEDNLKYADAIQGDAMQLLFKDGLFANTETFEWIRGLTEKQIKNKVTLYDPSRDNYNGKD